MSIVDLARAICPKCKTEIIGIRPGEKLHEVVVPKDEAYRTLEYEGYYLIKPDFKYFIRRFNDRGGKPVSQNFEYNSGTNQWRLTIDEMKEVIKSP